MAMESSSAAEGHRSVTVIVSGRVQGVFFRVSTLEKAQQLGVVGTVRNLPDDTVEIVAQGTSEAVEELLRWAHHGPPSAEVRSLAIRDEPPDVELKTFQVLR
jgi:acylphosphatase